MKGKKKGKVWKRSLQKKILRALSALPHGVAKMSADIAGLVETSTNVAIIKSEPKKITVITSQRSSVASELDEIQHTVGSIFELAGAEVNYSGGYPGWKPNMDSPILKIAKATYKQLYGREPHVKAIHAGLECGIIGERYPGMDMVSFGPTLECVHSPDEKIYIDTRAEVLRIPAGHSPQRAVAPSHTMQSRTMTAERPSPPAVLRWIVLVLVSLAMFGNYYIYDAISPLADVLKKQLGFTDDNIGLLQAIYSIPNIVMVLIGGFIIDRLGTKKSTCIFAFLCLARSGRDRSDTGLPIMAAGRLIFGLGAESHDRRGDNGGGEMVPGKGTELRLRTESDHRTAGLVRRPEFTDVGRTIL